MKGYKGFGPGMICLGKQYEENKVFEEDKVRICKTGMHFCERLMDVLDYYEILDENGNFNEFAEVEAIGDIERENNKLCTNKLKIGNKFSFEDFVKNCVTGLMGEVKLTASGDYSQLAASGDYSQLAASGNRSHLAASGNRSQLAASGDYSKLVASGNRSHLAASGDYSKLAASGDYSKLVASGDSSRLAASGNGFLPACRIWESLPACIHRQFFDSEKYWRQVIGYVFRR